MSKKSFILASAIIIIAFTVTGMTVSRVFDSKVAEPMCGLMASTSILMFSLYYDKKKK